MATDLPEDIVMETIVGSHGDERWLATPCWVEYLTCCISPYLEAIKLSQKGKEGIKAQGFTWP